MRVLLLHPNYHSGGAEIAGNWPPAWVAYLAGYLRAGGYRDVTFVDAMTNHLTDDEVRAKIREIRPDIVGCTAITPAIYKAEQLLRIAKEVDPAIVTVLGGIHGTFMYPQVLAEAPWIDAVVRGEGEQVFLNLVRAVDDGRVARRPARGQGHRIHRRRQGRRHAGRAADRRPRPDRPRLEHPRVGQVHLHPDGRARGHSQLRARLPVHLQLLQPVEVLARLPRPRPDQGRRRDRVARARPPGGLLHPRRRGADDPPQEVHRVLRGAHRAQAAGAVGHQHARHRHPARREAAAALPQGRADPRFARHRGRGAAEARPLQQGNDDRAEQEGDPAAARRRHRRRGPVHRRTRERNRRDARRDLPDGDGLEARHGQLGDVHAVAVLGPVPGAGRQGRRSSTSRSTTSSRRSSSPTRWSAPSCSTA